MKRPKSAVSCFPLCNMNFTSMPAAEIEALSHFPGMMVWQHSWLNTHACFQMTKENVGQCSFIPNSKWDSSVLMLSGDTSKFFEGCDSLRDE